MIQQFAFVLAQKYTDNITDTHETETFEVSCRSSSSAVYTGQSDLMKCTCNLNASFSLLCRHIFAVRAHLELPLYLYNNVPYNAQAAHSSESQHVTVSSTITEHVIIPRGSYAAAPKEKYMMVREVTESLRHCCQCWEKRLLWTM